MARYTSRHVTVRFEDSAALGMTIAPGPGDLSISEVNASNMEVIRVLDRGSHDGFVDGDDIVQDCSITISMTNAALTSGAVASVSDFLRKQGTFAAAASKDSTVWAWQCIVTLNDGTTVSTITLPVCEGGVAIAEGKEGNTLSISFRCYSAPVIA